MKITLTHPRSSDTFEADVTPECTGKEVLDGLVVAQFLGAPSPDRPYSLSHAGSKKQILPTTTLADAGVGEGDTVAVTQDGKGALGRGA